MRLTCFRRICQQLGPRGPALELFLSALFFWWSLFHASGRLGYGAAVCTSSPRQPTSILGALLTFAPYVLYPAYNATAARGWSALETTNWRLDMWVPAGLVYLGVGLALFAAWFARAMPCWNEGGMRTKVGIVLALLICMLVVSSCGNPGATRHCQWRSAPRGSGAIPLWIRSRHTIAGCVRHGANMASAVEYWPAHVLAGMLPQNSRKYDLYSSPKRHKRQAAMPDTGVTERDGLISRLISTLKSKPSLRIVDMITLSTQSIIAAAEKKAAEIGQPMNIAVVDQGGNLIAHVRMDDAWMGSVDISIKKAWTARAFDIATKDLAE